MVDIKLTLVPSNFILQKGTCYSPRCNSISHLGIIHIRKQQVRISVALAVERLKSSGNNTKLLVPHTITNQRDITTGSRTFTYYSFSNSGIPSKLAIAFVKSAIARGSWTNSSHKFEMFDE